MGCGGSVHKGIDVLERSEQELAEERKRLQEKDHQIARVQQQLQNTEEAAESSAQAVLATERLRSELQAHHEASRQELQRQKDNLLAAHREELQTTERDRSTRLSEELHERTQFTEETLQQQHALAERAQQAAMQTLREAAEAAAQRHVDAADVSERDLHRLRAQLGPLRQEHEEAKASLAEARLSLREEQATRASSTSQTSALERRLAESQEEHRRSEQRCTDLESHMRAQMRDLQSELKSCNADLEDRNTMLHRRDEELAEVNGQLADLQSLFDDVNRQLQAECSRIEKLQETVALCAKQSNELEQLQVMLEDSHRMLAQVRDALEEERAERIRIAGLLQHEQQRTQLLLDVLKHFKEKLQGLTPQVLLSRLGNGADAKALLASAGLSGLSPPVNRSGAASVPARRPMSPPPGGGSVAGPPPAWSFTPAAVGQPPLASPGAYGAASPAAAVDSRLGSGFAPAGASADMMARQLQRPLWGEANHSFGSSVAPDTGSFAAGMGVAPFEPYACQGQYRGGLGVAAGPDPFGKPQSPNGFSVGSAGRSFSYSGEMQEPFLHNAGSLGSFR